MSTRGFIGFVVDGTEKITYNHFDSYPAGLGADVLNWLRKAHHGGARRLAAELRVVDEDSSQPTAADIEKFRGYANTRVGSQEIDDWYVLLRETQGNPGAILDAGVMLDGSSLPTDSLFAEWGYIVDFDTDVLEAYKGFQAAPHKGGRFADRPPHHGASGYYPVRLVASWPLAELPTAEDFIAMLEPEEES